jgi:hypothetical protein
MERWVIPEARFFAIYVRFRAQPLVIARSASARKAESAPHFVSRTPCFFGRVHFESSQPSRRLDGFYRHARGLVDLDAVAVGAFGVIQGLVGGGDQAGEGQDVVGRASLGDADA